MKAIGAFAIAVSAVVAGLVGCSSESAAPPELPEPFDITAAAQPVITSVTTDDGFTQVRENATVTLVITGKRLQHTTSVTVGGFFVLSLDRVAAHEVRVSVFGSSNQPFGPVDVTVMTSQGTAVAPGAIQLTPFVVSPTAVTGHGTFQSPMSLCDPDLENSVDGRSLVQLLPGTHHCGRAINLFGGTIAGDPSQPTIVTGTDSGGFGVFAGGFGQVMTFRDLTFAPPLADWSIWFGGGELDIQRVNDAGGIIADETGFVKLDHYTYEGEGTGLDLHGAEITSSTIHHCGSGDGVIVRYTPGGGLTMHSSVVEDCDRGLVVMPPPQIFLRTTAEVFNSQFLDNGTGISASLANTTIQHTVVRGHSASPRVSSAGIAVGGGSSNLFDVEITGQRDIGLSIFHGNSDNQDALVSAGNLVIVGGHVGIGFGGIDNQLFLRASIVRDQTVASLAVSNLDGRTDLGTPDLPGNNQLSTIGGFVIDDSRFTESFFSRYVLANGTTLNGVSFDGQTIDGPAELAPFYRITSGDSGLRF